MKKIIVPEKITRGWLKEFSAIVGGASPMETAKNRMALLRSGALTEEDAERIREAKNDFYAEDCRREENENGATEVKKQLAAIAATVAAIPSIVATVKKFDNKVYDVRFRNAVKETPGARASTGYGCFEIEFSSGAETHTLAIFSDVEKILMPYEDGKKRRINAAAIVSELEKASPRLEKAAARIKKTADEIEKIRDKLVELREISDEIREYDRDIITAYGVSEYDLRRYSC